MKIFCLYILFFLSAFVTQAQDWTVIGEFESGIGDMLGDEKSNRLYVVGRFDSINGKYMRGIAAWDGKQWNDLDHGIHFDTVPHTWGGGAQHISRYKGKLVVGGSFDHVGYYKKSRNAALWNLDSLKWDTLNWNTDRSVQFVYDTGDTTYVLGTYDSIGGIKSKGANFLYQGQWTNMSPPKGVSIPRVLATFQGSLYLGGNMNNSIPGANDLARWDGVKFHSVGHGVDGAFGIVTDLVEYKNELYVGGAFYKADGHTGEHIMKWDGQKFYNVGDAENSISDLEVHHGVLFSVGEFLSIGGISAKKIAWFDGDNWHTLGNEDHSGVGKISFLNDTLYIYREQIIDGINHHQVLRYNKRLPTNIEAVLKNNQEIQLFPNPTSQYIELKNLKPNSIINIYDVTGTLVLTGTSSKIEVFHFKSGLYFVRIKSNQQITNLKFLKQ